jgi:hypothetical protein
MKIQLQKYLIASVIIAAPLAYAEDNSNKAPEERSATTISTPTAGKEGVKGAPGASGDMGSAGNKARPLSARDDAGLKKAIEQGPEAVRRYIRTKGTYDAYYWDWDASAIK